MRFLWLAALACAALTAADDNTGWSTYGRDAAGTHYSPLKQIDRSNVANLTVAWTYHTGALTPASKQDSKAAFESTPILFNGTLYLTTPFNQVIALDPATGAERWKFDPKIDRSAYFSEVASRGVASWTDPRASRAAACRTRVFEGTIDARLIALDAATGKPCPDFGSGGTVDLTSGVDLKSPGDYQVTSAPTVVSGLVITGSSIGDNRGVNLERGVVRAYDARTGELRWTWDPIPWANNQKLRTGAANAWSTFAADPARDLVFVPTGSASPDFYGGERPGDDKYANSVVALRASTGKLVWGFQVVHHDLWDYDVASQPTLIDFKGQPAVAVTTKMGNVFVLDRRTGEPLSKVSERAVPKSDIAGEQSSPTQPFPAWSPMNPQSLTAEQAWGPTPEVQAWCKERIASLRNEGLFTPPTLGGSLQMPGNVGGVNWGGAAFDAERNLLIANTNHIAFVVKLIPRDRFKSAVHEGERLSGEFAPQNGTPYGMYREPLLSPAGTPCNRPPWGTIVAFDLNTGAPRWQTPLGEMKPGLKTGSPNLGGPMATAGGLVFSAAAMDTYIRAFDTDTGAELWKAELPASAQATPMTYEVGGKQYIVICAGGHGKLGTKLGDAVVAFALK